MKSVAEILSDKWTPEPYSGCWLWTGAVTDNNYGRVVVDGKSKRAHRLSWEIRNGKIPEGSNVLHRCDTRQCINPDHLFLGSHVDNRTDCVQKNRHAKGMKHGLSKLNADKVRQIRVLSFSLSNPEIAKRFNVSTTVVRLLLIGKTWKHVT